MQVFCNTQSSLHKLSVLRTKLTQAGIIFALKHLPELKELSSSTNFLKVFFRIWKETRESKIFSLTKFSLPTMILTERGVVPYKKGVVSWLVDMCPSLVDLIICVEEEEFRNAELLGEKI
jgi:hypothetical protein